MRKISLKILVLVLAVFMMIPAVTPVTMNMVYATKPAQTTGSDGNNTNDSNASADSKKNCVKTAILGENGESCDDGSGSSVKSILSLVVEIMTVGVGILSVIGISVVGIQYLTAGGDEAQTRKAKRRMFEIIIGIILYVAAFALMSWLIPDFKPFQ